MTQNESPHEGTFLCVPAGRPWRGGDITWCTSHSCHLSVGVNKVERVSRAALSAQQRHLSEPWEQGRHSEEGGREFGWRISVQMWMECGARGAQPGSSFVGSMAARNSVTWEGNHSDHITRRNGGEEGVGGLNAEEGDDRAAGQSEEDLGERWFR